MKTEPLSEIMYEALQQEFGVKVETDDPHRLRQKLYAVRKGNPDFAGLSIIASRLRPDDELLIIKREVSDAEEGPEGKPE